MININFFFIGITGMIFSTLLKVNDTKKRIYKSNKDSQFVFLPEDISIEDDGFHESEAPRFTEWWYFDAVFDNGYSAQMSVRLLSIIKKRLVLIFQRLDIYKDGVLVIHNRKRCSLKKFEAIHEIPLVKLGGKQVINGYIDKNTGNWVYDLSFEINDTSVNLRFEGHTWGWKGRNPGGDWWAVLLPRAEAKGTININNKQINVRGIGYHDHNWDVRSRAAKNLGWFWGKINFKNFTVTWATIFKDMNVGQPLLVINKVKEGYINVLPKNIDFVGDDLCVENGKIIPHRFVLQTNTENVTLNVAMKVLKIHHVKMMLRMHYWRFHVSCKGSLKVGLEEESVDETHIAEFIRFR
jgi:predicted secreted hydrolase